MLSVLFGIKVGFAVSFLSQCVAISPIPSTNILSLSACWSSFEFGRWSCVMLWMFKLSYSLHLDVEQINFLVKQAPHWVNSALPLSKADRIKFKFELYNSFLETFYPKGDRFNPSDACYSLKTQSNYDINLTMNIMEQFWDTRHQFRRKTIDVTWNSPRTCPYRAE